jgi:hypothetical protein
VQPLNLQGGHHTLAHPVIRWHSERSDSDPNKVVLTASVGSDPKAPTTTGGKLAIQMDAAIAEDLHDTLGELGRLMGWLPRDA